MYVCILHHTLPVTIASYLTILSDKSFLYKRFLWLVWIISYVLTGCCESNSIIFFILSAKGFLLVFFPDELGLFDTNADSGASHKVAAVSPHVAIVASS